MKHFRLTNEMRRRKLNSTGTFEDACLCGNGSYHVTRIDDAAKVDCPRCLEVLATNPEYIRNG